MGYADAEEAPGSCLRDLWRALKRPCANSTGCVRASIGSGASDAQAGLFKEPTCSGPWIWLGCSNGNGIRSSCAGPGEDGRLRLQEPRPHYAVEAGGSTRSAEPLSISVEMRAARKDAPIHDLDSRASWLVVSDWGVARMESSERRVEFDRPQGLRYD